MKGNTYIMFLPHFISTYSHWDCRLWLQPQSSSYNINSFQLYCLSWELLWELCEDTQTHTQTQLKSPCVIQPHAKVNFTMWDSHDFTRWILMPYKINSSCKLAYARSHLPNHSIFTWVVNVGGKHLHLSVKAIAI